MILRSDPSWYTAHIGVLSASRMPDAMAVLKNGKPGAARKRLLIELVGERMEGILCDHFVTQAMKDGLARQPEAISEYEIETGAIVGPEAFMNHPTIEYLGATPDGFIGEDGLLEVKCCTMPVHLQYFLGGVVPEEHKPQMALQLLCCPGRTWVHFEAFRPSMPPKQRKFIYTFEPTTEYLETIENEAVKVLAEVEQLFEQATTS